MPLDGVPILNATRYLQLVGNLIYLTFTHSDISHALSIFSKFMDVMVFTTPLGLFLSYMFIQMQIG